MGLLLFLVFVMILGCYNITTTLVSPASFVLFTVGVVGASFITLKVVIFIHFIPDLKIAFLCVTNPCCFLAAAVAGAEV